MTRQMIVNSQYMDIQGRSWGTDAASVLKIPLLALPLFQVEYNT